MDENVTEKFYIKTKLEKSDYRKFLLFSIFIKRRYTLPILFGISFLGALVGCYLIENMSMGSIVLTTLFYFALAVAAVMVKSELRQKRAVKSDHAGMFDTITHLKFYENDMVIQSEKIEGYTKIGYDQFFEVVESKYFYLMYVIHNQAHVIRKVDVPDIDAFSSFLKEKFGAKYSKR